LISDKTHTNVAFAEKRDFLKQEVKVIWQKAPHGGPIPRLGVTPGGRKLCNVNFSDKLDLSYAPVIGEIGLNVVLGWGMNSLTAF